MTKSFGEIMAEGYMETMRQKAHLIHCPLCGYPLYAEDNVTYFCYVSRDDHLKQLQENSERAYEYQRAGGILTFQDFDVPPYCRGDNWRPEMQGVIIAVSETGKSWFYTTRGGGGKTNFKVELHDPPTVKWVLAEWWS